MKQIQLTHGYFAIVDDKDYEELNKFKWHAHFAGNTVYARRNKMVNRKVTITYMHRQVIGQSCVGLDVDHIDGNGLNNQRSNLRACLHSENISNQRKSKMNTSGFRGVCFHKKANKYLAQIIVKGRYLYLGIYSNILDAAMAYDLAASEHFGEYARLNFPKAINLKEENERKNT